MKTTVAVIIDLLNREETSLVIKYGQVLDVQRMIEEKMLTEASRRDFRDVLDGTMDTGQNKIQTLAELDALRDAITVYRKDSIQKMLRYLNKIHKDWNKERDNGCGDSCGT